MMFTKYGAKYGGFLYIKSGESGGFLYIFPSFPFGTAGTAALGQSGKTFDVLDEQLKPLADVLSEETKWWLQKVVFFLVLTLWWTNIAMENHHF